MPKTRLTVQDLALLVVSRAKDWREEPGEETLEQLADAVDALGLLQGLEMQGLTPLQMELLLFVQTTRAELMGCLATLEVAILTPNVPDDECKRMAATLTLGVEAFIHYAEAE